MKQTKDEKELLIMILKTVSFTPNIITEDENGRYIVCHFYFNEKEKEILSSILKKIKEEL